MRRSMLLLGCAAALTLAGAADADDRFGNPYRYYRAPSYYDSQAPYPDFNEARRQTLQFLYRHQVIPQERSRIDRFEHGRARDFYRPYRRPYFYSSPYIYYHSPSYYGLPR